MSAETSTFMIMHDLDDRPIGHEDSTAYGHVSITPFFTVETERIGCMTDAVHEVAEIFEPFAIWPVGYSLFGLEHSKPVVEIASEDGQLRELHDYCMRMLGSIGCRFKTMAFTGRRFAPHTRQLSFCLEDEWTVDSISLVRCPPRPNKVRSRIFDVISLGGLTEPVFDSQRVESLVQ